MAIVRGSDIVVQGDLGQKPFILDRDHLDASPGSELTPYSSAWDDTTCVVTSAQWTWGAGEPLGPLTEVEGGRASINLYDPARDFDPSNTTSPYYLYLRVGMPLRVLVDGAPAWTGTLEAWESDVGELTSTLLAIDAVGTLAALVLPPGTVLPAGDTATQAGAVLDAVAWPAVNRTFTGTSSVNRLTVTVGGQAMAALHAIRFAELGALFGTRAGSIAVWSRTVAGTVGSPTALINCGGVGLVGLASVFNRGRVRNIVRIDDTVAPYAQVLDASETRHGPRTVSTSQDELQFALAGRAAAFGAWADTILGKLGNPRPATRLGTLVPEGAAEVGAILRAEWGDVWRVVDDHAPPIDRLVRVLGERVSITPTTVEVDAVTEDV